MYDPEEQQAVIRERLGPRYAASEPLPEGDKAAWFAAGWLTNEYMTSQEQQQWAQPTRGQSAIKGVLDLIFVFMLIPAALLVIGVLYILISTAITAWW